MLYVIGFIIVFIMVLMVFTARTNEDTLLTGFWRASPDFCERAELSMYVLYLGDNTNYVGNSRYGYVVAANNAGIILNNPFEMSLFDVTAMPYMVKERNYNATIKWLEDEADPEIFPSELQIAYYPKHGKLVLYNDDQVLVTLWKDCNASAVNHDDLMPETMMEN